MPSYPSVAAALAKGYCAVRTWYLGFVPGYISVIVPWRSASSSTAEIGRWFRPDTKGCDDLRLAL